MMNKEFKRLRDGDYVELKNGMVGRITKGPSINYISGGKVGEFITSQERIKRRLPGVEMKRLMVVVDKRHSVIIVDEEGRKFISRCHPEDEWDEKEGVRIAFERYFEEEERKREKV